MAWPRRDPAAAGSGPATAPHAKRVKLDLSLAVVVEQELNQLLVHNGQCQLVELMAAVPVGTSEESVMVVLESMEAANKVLHRDGVIHLI